MLVFSFLSFYRTKVRRGAGLENGQMGEVLVVFSRAARESFPPPISLRLPHLPDSQDVRWKLRCCKEKAFPPYTAFEGRDAPGSDGAGGSSVPPTLRCRHSRLYRNRPPDGLRLRRAAR